ncbi:DNA-binding response regulator [Flavobacterium sp. '19STA2R22 D10 B1']|uniref:DNA-binding response regulator n=1 Tax=Flavobacterium aerium TaxID=3037261 RepID=UPI00278BF813|nr:response regulator transcription factor [Flavobacterium sp. '19STA2R22 D10 B1']
MNILMVDDHPFIIEAYKNTIAGYQTPDQEVVITQASNCKAAYEIITNPNVVPFDVAFLDISMPPYVEKNILSGEDLAKLLKRTIPACRIILLTMHTEVLKISSIIKTINPNGLIIKNDLTFDELLLAFDKIIKNENYYSQTVVKYISQSMNEDVLIDDLDRQILFHLSRGVKTKNIPLHTSLSLSTVEKRKLNIKELFKVRTDEDLIREAKLRGFI